MTRILFIADGSLDRPILHSQGIPLLKRLCELGMQCYIQSFEENNDIMNSELGRDLSARGIHWMPVIPPLESGSFQRIGMIVGGFRDAWQLCKRERIDIIHARSYRPAVIGSLLKKCLGTGFIFDMRGFLIDEQIMLGRWQARGIKYRTARWMEQWCLLSADMIVTNTLQFTKRVQELPYIAGTHHMNSIISITNSVDIERFKSDPAVRDLYRRRMNWENRIVLIFSGEVRSWEDFGSIVRFFHQIKQKESSVFLALFVYGEIDVLKKEVEEAGLLSSDYCIMTVPSKEMPNYLAASDIGILFRKGNPFTQEIHTPIKFAEYLACGLPVAITPGIGDTWSIVDKYRAGVLVDPSDTEQFNKSAVQIIDLIQNDPGLRNRCRAAAERELSLDISVNEYLRVYQRAIQAKEIEHRL